MTAAPASVLDTLLSQVDDPSLRASLSAEFEKMRGQRRFGLVFDRKQPETVRLPNHPIRRGGLAGNRDEAPGRYLVTGFTDRTRQIARCVPVDDLQQPIGEPVELAVTDLVAMRDFGDPIYPGLVPAPIPAGWHSLGADTHMLLAGEPDAPVHSVIQGENFHVLQALSSTHHESIDIIYIDPPYNTGGQAWIYNDKFVDSDRTRAASSTWLSFMERRLELAKSLLKPTGVIFVAIGDQEHHRLRMLMDQVFGAENFISDIVWQGGRKNDSRWVSNGADYMLTYGRSTTAMTERDIRWREDRPGVDTVLAAGADAWNYAKGDLAVATARLRAWFSSLPKDHPAKRDGNYNYNRIDENGRVFYANDLRSPNPRPNLQYDLIHPVTGGVTMRHPNGWAYSRESMDALIAAGNIWFDDDNTRLPRLKKYLDEQDAQVAMSIFEKDRRRSSRQLQAIFGDKRFPFPKDHEVLQRWISLAAPKDAVVLDFFGGSGSTLEAVLRLNAEDAGTRQCILVTNNEVGPKEAKTMRAKGLAPGDADWEAKGVFEYVTRPRIATVVTGVREDGSVYGNGLNANVAFHKLTYLDPGMVRAGAEYAAIAPLLWMQAGGVGPVIDSIPDEGYAVTDTYGVLFSMDGRRAFIDEVANRPELRMVFVVTDSTDAFADVTAQLPIHVERHRLYESYLTNFEVNTEGGE